MINAIFGAEEFQPRVAAAINRQGETALHLAAWKGDTDSIVLLKKYGSGVAGSIESMRDTSGHTPLHLAIIHGHCGGNSQQSSSASVLLARKGAPLAPDSQHPLHLAAAAGHKHCAAEILDQQSGTAAQESLSATDALQYTPLHTAAANGRADVVRLLCERFEDTDVQLNRRAVGMTASEMAVAGGHHLVVRELTRCATSGLDAD